MGGAARTSTRPSRNRRGAVHSESSGVKENSPWAVVTLMGPLRPASYSTTTPFRVTLWRPAVGPMRAS